MKRSRSNYLTQNLTCTEKDLELKFNQLVMAVITSLQQTNLQRLKVYIQILLPNSDDEESMHEQVNKQKTSSDILVFLKRKRVIGFRNPKLLEDIIQGLLSDDEEIVTQLSQYKKKYEELLSIEGDKNTADLFESQGATIQPKQADSKVNDVSLIDITTFCYIDISRTF